MRSHRYSGTRFQAPDSGVAAGSHGPAGHLPLFVILVGASLGLIAADVHYGFDWLTRFSGRLASPISTGLDQVIRPFSSLSIHVRETLGARRDNNDLRARVAELERENLALEEAQQENVRLRDLLNLKAETAPSAMAAPVIRYLDSPTKRAIILRAGRNQGLEVGQPVLSDSNQLLGRVVETSPNSATVRLLVDPVSRVRVTLERTGAQGTIYSRDGSLRLRLDRSEPVQEGDRLRTSHLSTAFPEGLMVGVVVGEDEDPEGDPMVAVEMGLMNNYRVEGALPISRWGGIREVLCLPGFRQTPLEMRGED